MIEVKPFVIFLASALIIHLLIALVLFNAPM